MGLCGRRLLSLAIAVTYIPLLAELKDVRTFSPENEILRAQLRRFEALCLAQGIKPKKIGKRGRPRKKAA
jgi:hypothetical protein